MRNLIVAILAVAAVPVSAADFGAYYTRVDSGEPFEKFSRTGPHADVVVRGIGPEKGRLVFWRGSSYLPYWQVGEKTWFLEELIERSGDGPEKRPDRVNTYSVVRIIESSPSRAVVHWRYLPKFEGENPHFNETNLRFHRDKLGEKKPKHLVTTTAFVDEYFTVTPDGRVTRTFRKGTERFDDWVNPKNVRVQEIRLTGAGATVEKTAEPGTSAPAGPIQGNPVRDKTVVAPVKWWKFDEGAGNATREAVAGDACEVAGHCAYWKRGVSGTALAFDGYTSAIRLPAEKAPAVADAVTLEGWVALGAYPWNWTPIVQQGHDESYYLGIGPHGHVAMRVKAGSDVRGVESRKQLERKRWYYVAGTFDKATGVLRVFIDGEQCGEHGAPKNNVARSTAPVRIGQGKPMAQSDPVRRNTFEDTFSFDGLIDEVRIYDTALSPEQVAASHEAFGLSDAMRSRPDLDKRVLPTGRNTGRFGAYYTHLKFYDTWDGLFRFSEHPDVVVEFDRHPTRFVFWRGTCYITMMVNEAGQWYSNEFNETWNRSGGRGCQEPMSDKESFSNHARILENTPARCVVLWRYPLVDVLHTIANYDPETGWGDWSDWIYTIYPDGVAAKQLICWTDGSSRHEWHEGMVITGPDQHPEQVLETDPALVLATLDGETRAYSWKNGPPKDVDYRDVKIHVVNFKGEYDPFTIADIRGGNVYSGEVTDYSVFPSWNHWPVAQMPSDGRYAKHPDRTAHSSLTHVNGPREIQTNSDRPYERMLMLEGMTKQKPEALVRLARSWLHAPPIKTGSGCKTFGYDQGKREYPLVATDERMAVTIEASDDRPIVNLCFAVRNWGDGSDASLRVGGKKPAGVRQGTFVDTDGTNTMVIWVERESTAPTEFTIAGARPAADYAVPVYLTERMTKPKDNPRPRGPSRNVPKPDDSVTARGPVLRWDESKAFDGKSVVEFKDVDKLLAAKSMTWSAWFKTKGEGTIVCLTGDGREWVRGGGTLFVRNGNLVFDIGWVGQADAARNVADGEWHHVAVTMVKQGAHFYLDGKYQGSAGLAGIGRVHRLQRFKIGFTNDDFPNRNPYFTGEIRNVAVYDYAMPDAHVKRLYETSR
jgi:hypothetical protein